MFVAHAGLLPVNWRGDSRTRVRAFPRAARVLAGDELFRLQLGLEPKHWRALASVAPGVREIRISTQGEFRIIYLLESHEEVIVLHAFAKKTQQTARRDIEVARQRVRDLRQRG